VDAAALLHKPSPDLPSTHHADSRPERFGCEASILILRAPLWRGFFAFDEQDSLKKREQEASQKTEKIEKEI